MGFLTSIFAHPWLVGGAIAGSIPIIIHLLNKQRYKKHVWAAMHWLWAAYKKQSRRLRLEQLLLLIIRVLILVLLALALARPRLQEGVGALAGQASRHRVIVIDNSFSMGHVVNGKELFAKAKDLSVGLVEELSIGDDVDVILANSVAEDLSSSTSDHQKLIGFIKDAKLSDGHTHMPKAIAAACRTIKERDSQNVKKEIILITDENRSGWQSGTNPKKLDTGDEGVVAQIFENPATRPKVYIVRLKGDNRRDNISVTDLTIDEKVVTAGVETQMVATVHNFGSTAISNLELDLYVSQEKVSRESIENLDPYKSGQIIFRHTFVNDGSHAVKVKLVKPDSLPVDDEAFLAVDVEKQVRVLLVDGQQRNQANASELDFLRQALSPSQAEKVNAGRMPLFPEVISDGAFPDHPLDGYRLIILGNVRMMPEEKVEHLVEFVKTGGALWIWLGDRVDPQLYNKELGELLPAEVGEAIGKGEASGQREKLDDQPNGHPAVEKFQGIKHLHLSDLQIFRRFKLKPKTGEGYSTVRTALQLENEDPVAVDFRLGDGRVLLMGTTADAAWNDWPPQLHYMPLVNFLALDMIQPAYALRNRKVGEPFSFKLSSEQLGNVRREGLTLQTPRKESQQMDLSTANFTVTSKPVKDAGIFLTELTEAEDTKTLHFAANRVEEESDLDTIDEKEVLAHIPAGEGEKPELSGFFENSIHQGDFHLLGEDLKQISAIIQEQGSAREIWRWLIIAVLVLLVFESLLAKRFGSFTK